MALIQSKLGTIEVDTITFSKDEHDVYVNIINTSYYGTGAIGDIALPKNLIEYKNEVGSSAESFTIIDEASPVVKTMQSGYNASENSSSFLRLIFSEAISFKSDSVKVLENDDDDDDDDDDDTTRSITFGDEVSGDKYTLKLSGFVKGDQIKVKDNKDISDKKNEMEDTLFKLVEESGNLYWIKVDNN
jgi:hypothetical protein